MQVDIKDIVKGTVAELQSFRSGKLYYKVQTDKNDYIFTVPVSDENEVGNATFNRTEKAMTLMRYVRQAIESDELAVVAKA